MLEYKSKNELRDSLEPLGQTSFIMVDDYLYSTAQM